MSFDALLDADFKTVPWIHQYREFEYSADLPARAFLWQMRTGKSKMTTDTAASLFRRQRINGLLLFAPNGVHANWVERELPLHMWDGIDYTALAWRTKVAGLKGGNRLSKADKAAWEDAHAEWWATYLYCLKEAAFPILSFNTESVIRPDIKKALAKLVRKRNFMAAWDESSDYRTPGASRTIMMRHLSKHIPYRRILDGTAITNSPLHAYSQFQLLKPGALGYATYEPFEERYGVFETGFNRGTGKEFRVLTGFQNLEELRASMAPWSSVVLRTDCVDLPDLVPRRRKIPFSDEQRRVYAEVKAQTLIEIARDEMASINAQAARIQKLQQVGSGFLIDTGKKVHKIRGANPRLEAVSEEVYLASGRVIVWCQFHEELDQVAARLRLDGWQVMEYHGRVTDEDKANVRVNFPRTEGKVVLVGHPASAGRGLQLPADLIIWYSPTFNGIHRQQANERATVMGGANVSLVDFAAPEGVDGYIIDTVQAGIDIADDVAGRGLQRILTELTHAER